MRLCSCCGVIELKRSGAIIYLVTNVSNFMQNSVLLHAQEVESRVLHVSKFWSQWVEVHIATEMCQRIIGKLNFDSEWKRNELRLTSRRIGDAFPNIRIEAPPSGWEIRASVQIGKPTTPRNSSACSRFSPRIFGFARLNTSRQKENEMERQNKDAETGAREKKSRGWLCRSSRR